MDQLSFRSLPDVRDSFFGFQQYLYADDSTVEKRS